MAKIKIKNKNSLPKGFTVRNGKVIKTYDAGGATVSRTLNPVNRDAANLEAEKGEMALTDTSGDGVFELYNIGGKRHTEGGTPLNLPEQSFIYSDTRGMLLTIDEMKSLGIDQNKRITPAEAAKKFPLNKYIEILEDNTSDKISIETAEQMINKNKINLSQIAFIQESKKDFENGLPLAAFPYLMSKGVDPQQFQQKIDEVNAKKNSPQEGMPPGMPPQGMPPGMPPQGMPPGMPPQGGIPPEMMQQMMAAQGMPPGMQEPQMMEEGGQTPLEGLLSLFNKPVQFAKESYSTDNGASTSANNTNKEEGKHLCAAYGNPPPSAAMKHAADTNKNYKGPGMKYGGDLMPYQTMGEVDPEASMNPFPKFQDQGEIETVDPNNQIEFDLVEKCKNQRCSYDEWRFAYRLKDIPEVKFMYESYLTKAIDKTKASGTSTEIMPGHENLKNASYNIPSSQPDYKNGGSTYTMPDPTYSDYMNNMSMYAQMGVETGMNQPMVPTMGVPPGYVRDQNPLGLPGMQRGGDLRRFVYGGQDNENISIDRSNDIELDPISPSYISNPEFRYLGYQLETMQQRHNLAIKYHQENPKMFKEKKVQKEFEEELNLLQNEMKNVEFQMRNLQRREILKGSIMDIDSNMSNINMVDGSQYTGYNPAMEGVGMMMAKNGMELPKFPIGAEICTHGNCGKNHLDIYNSENGKAKAEADADAFEKQLNSEDFKGIRKGWIDAYKATVQEWDDMVTDLGGMQAIEDAIRQRKSIVVGQNTTNLNALKALVKNQPIAYTNDDAMFASFLKINRNLLRGKSAQYESKHFKGKDKKYHELCKELEFGDCDPEQITKDAKIFQGMYRAMNQIRETDDDPNGFFSNVSLQPTGDFHAGERHQVNGKPISEIDGIIGMTTFGQHTSLKNEITEEKTEIKVPCTEEEAEAKSAICLKENKNFDRTTCECTDKTIPGDFVPGDTPHYMTFPQDDLRLQNAIGQKWNRNLYMPTRQNIEPALPDVAYQDPQAMIQANLSMAQQLAKADPQNASYYMGQISDQINKGISDVSNTNIKIFDNSEARKSQILNDAMSTNSANRDEYNTRVATALNNFDNTMIADNANITDVQVDRMDNADKLYALNMDNPNFYYDAQNHMNKYYNPQDIFANADKTSSGMTMDEASTKCQSYGYKSGTSEFTGCMKMMIGDSSENSTTPTRENSTKKNDNIIDDSDSDDGTARHGKETGCSSCNRKKELEKSRIALRNWIFGV